MKKLCALLLAALLLSAAALADVDNSMLETAPGMMVYLSSNNVDLVIRPEDQPFIGATDQDDVEAVIYLDMVEMPNEHATVVRLMVCLASYELVNANELRITEGGKTYTFDLWNCRTVSEYDMDYYEDYAVCLTDEGLPLLKAMARSKSDARTLVLTGDRQVTVKVEIPGDDCAALYDLYVKAGGDKQTLELLRDLWPVTVTK